MTDVGPVPAGTAAAAAAMQQRSSSFVDWGAIIAGAVLASAISFVLLTFGATIGLTATSPWPNSGLSAKFAGGLAAFWIMAQQIGAFLAGGYIAGRMRGRWADASQDEVEFRDGLHGGLVWAAGIAVGAALIMMTAGATARLGVETAGKTVTSLAATAANPMDAALDAMLRPTAAGPAVTGGAATPQPNPEAQRAELARVLAGAVSAGSLSGPNRTYASQVVARRAGIPQPEAEKRVDEALNAAREAVDKARRTAITVGSVTAIALVISFAAAWWGAMTGGRHRDNSLPARFSFAPIRARLLDRR